MPAFLIRHASAGDRSHWRDDDERRPLDDRGHRTAEALARTLGSEAIIRVLSSPAARCRQTVEPLAEKLGLEVEVTHDLQEGVTGADVLDVVERTGDGVVLCAHGDAIPGAIRRLATRGAVRVADVACQKGSIWVLDMVEGAVVDATYLAPPR